MQNVVRSSRTNLFIRVLLLIPLFCLPAFATLGENVTSVQSDQVHMKGSVRVTQNAAYSVHEIRAEPGVVVKEYASPEGKVFAVAWQSPGHPDMHQLLGAYFNQYAQAIRTKTSRRGPLLIQQSGLVIQIRGHARAFAGKVYIPQMLPQGVRPETIQ
jgi:hypothetical protein